MTARARPSAAPVMLRVLSDPAYLCVVRAAVERFCLLAGFDEKGAQAIGLALDEALANVINHGYDGRCDQPIHVELRMERATGDGGDGGAGAGDGPARGVSADRGRGSGAGDGTAGELRICVRDFGRQVDASQINPRPLGEIRPGGLGVHIIRQVFDRVEYRKRGLRGMELSMTKRKGDAT